MEFHAQIYNFLLTREKATATRYNNLAVRQKEKAAAGLSIYLKNCRRAEIGFDMSAIREIIADAGNNKFFVIDNERDRREAKHLFLPTAQSSLRNLV